MIEKNQVEVSVCKSNLKENTYYGRVKNKEKITTERLLGLASNEFSFNDTTVLQAEMENLIRVMLEYVEKGFTVEFFNLGSFKLSGKGSLKVKDHMEGAMQSLFNQKEGKSIVVDGIPIPTGELANETMNEAIEESLEETAGSYCKEINAIAKESMTFNLQFTPSHLVKKHVETYVEPSVIMAKIENPRINKVEKLYSCSSAYDAPSVIKIEGENLKLVGNKTGLLIKLGKTVFKIPKEAVLRNEPKTLMFLANIPIKDNLEYTLFLNTQYAKMGNRQTSIVRRCVKKFSFEKAKDRVMAYNVS